MNSETTKKCISCDFLKAIVEFGDWLKSVEWRGVSSEVYDEFQERMNTVFDVLTPDEKNSLIKSLEEARSKPAIKYEG